ncbi:MAG: 5'-nucleotidase C-terminal domain-containing protein [Spirochaetaceae bacterium]|jgi:5'-nucleotidase/UDP-sugar diphosphatase|nr:5'-nucleotidase C-terminal domain-containing protein [Spirochaetaceae bacterium]
MKSFKKLSGFAAIVLAASLALNCVGKQGASELILLHTNDHHGSVLPNDGKGGLAEQAAYIKAVKAVEPQVLLVDAGDINTGSALSNMFNAEPDIKGYNIMGYDALVFGNHEFDGKQEKLLAQMALADAPFVSSNIKTADGAFLGGRQYLVKRYDGFTVGIFGLTTLRTKIIASPDASLEFINEVEAARAVVDILRNTEKVAVVIGVTHIGNVKEAPDHITSPELAAAVPGIDIIVDGHSHSYIAEPIRVNDTYIVTANEWGKYVGHGKLTVRGGKLAGFSWKAIPIGPDPEVTEMLAPYISIANESLKEVVGQAQDTFVFGKRRTRYQETALGDMVCDANVWYFRSVHNQQLDFALQNGGNIRAEIPKGPITREQILTMLPFENYLFIATLKGKEIIELFDFIAGINQGAGAFAQVSKEVRYTIDYTSGKGRLEGLTINGAPVESERDYRFCTNDYLLGGGDGYTVLTQSREPFNTSLLLSSVVVEYIRAQKGLISPATDGRITVVGGVSP